MYHQQPKEEEMRSVPFFLMLGVLGFSTPTSAQEIVNGEFRSSESYYTSQAPRARTPARNRQVYAPPRHKKAKKPIVQEKWVPFKDERPDYVYDPKQPDLFRDMLFPMLLGDVGKRSTQIKKNAPRSLWCAWWVSQYFKGDRPDGGPIMWARDYLKVGIKAEKGCVGCIAVLSRGRNAGHIGVVHAYDKAGNPILISGNSSGGKVTKMPYAKGRVLGYRWVEPREGKIVPLP